MSTAMAQGSKEWLEWRWKDGTVPASEIPIVLGESDFLTPYQYWEIRTGRKPPQKENWAMRRGTNAEDSIRALYNLKTGLQVEPKLFESDFGKCSLDGWSPFDGGLVVEIKFPSKEKHAEAKAGRVPQTYVAQIQTQLKITGARKAHYVSYDGTDIEIVEVFPDEEFQKRIATAAKEFQRYITTDTPPPFTDKDFVEVTDTSDAALFAAFRDAKLSYDEAYSRLESLKKELKEKYADQRVCCQGIKVFKVSKKGTVDYEKIPELAGVDLEKYRKPGTEYMEIRMGGSKK